jgi:hypothetical protein
MVPRYLKATVRSWLAGDDVPKPRKPKKAVKKAAKKAAAPASLGHPHVAERHASKVAKRARKSATR